MRVLLINSNLKKDLLAAPPIGLCYVANATEEAGHDVRVLDLCFRYDIKKELTESVQTFSPEVIGISIRNIDNANMLHPVSYIPGVVEIVEHVRKISHVPIVLGGSGASLIPFHTLKATKADYIVVADGEPAFVGMLDAMMQGKPPEKVPGVGIIRNGEFQLTPPEFKDFSIGHSRLGKWIDVKPYRKVGGSYTIQSKRGCRHRCIYCVYNSILEGYKIRLRSPVEVVDELEEAINKWQPDIFEFADSVFNDPKDHCVEVLEEIIRRPLKAKFTTMGVSPRNLDLPFLKLMWRAGFTSFMISPESASETMIRNYRKGFNADDIVLAAEAINQTRFTPLWYFLIGGPGEKNETVQETIDFTLKYLKREKRPPYHNCIYFLGVRIYPGTDLWDLAMEEGMINENSDPLQQCWYVSKQLDLDRAVKQMSDAAAICPEIYLGFDERFLAVSKLTSFFGNLFRMPKPYWRHLWGMNRFLLKSRIRFLLKPPDVVGMLGNSLQRQGYRGPLLDRSD
jgi:radical SAM superfamily enzyme YgiQ (UPF0313 family)